MNDVILARALHVVAVVVWIGGLSFATTVLLPAIRRGDLGADRLKAFRAAEHRFAWQTRVAILVVGASGFYMAARLDLWERFRSAEFWWMHAMVAVWLAFALILFVAEPLVLPRRTEEWAATRPDHFFTWLHRAHWVLWAASLVTIFGAVAGSQGWPIF